MKNLPFYLEVPTEDLLQPITSIGVSHPLITSIPEPHLIQMHAPANKSCGALWDSGAGLCSISTKFAQFLDLKPLKHRPQSTSGGNRVSNLYFVSISFGNGWIIPKLLVSDFDVGDLTETERGNLDFNDNVHALIGMQIISVCDFNITHSAGRSKFSCTVPSNSFSGGPVHIPNMEKEMLHS